MAGVRLYASNDLDRLAKLLVQLLDEATPADAFAPQTVVVQDWGVQRWLTLRLADAHGICAQVEFLLPKDFVTRCLTGSSRAVKLEAYSTETMTWALMDIWAKGSPCSEVAAYLGDDPDGMKAYGLAQRLAHLFDQYMVYRQELVADWLAGRHTEWQGALWWQLRQKLGQDPVTQHQRFQDLPDRARTPFPGTVCFFGLGMLPPAYLRVIRAAATVQPIHVLAMQPTEHLWTDLLTQREQSREWRDAPPAAAPAARGHRLLESWGRNGREFQDLLLDELQVDAPQNDCAPSSGDTLLTQLQRDIYNVDATGPRRPAPVDDSIQIHSCHSRPREVEVLNDWLLHLFKMSDLKPHDVVVMAPDIEAYAPHLRAVFDNPEDEAQRIPYTLADRSPRHTSSVISSFLTLLETWAQPMPVSGVLSLLETGAVRQRFRLEMADVQRLHDLCREVRIHWGYDVAHRAESGAPPDPQNTWRWGLDRVLLGSIMKAEEERLCEGLLPLGEVDADAARVVAAMDELTAALREATGSLGSSRTLAQWADVLATLFNQLFACEKDELGDERTIRAALDALEEGSKQLQGPIPIEPVRAALEARLGKGESRDGFLRGAVTCCALKPLRNVPFKVICVLGLDDGQFPRAGRQDGLDLQTKSRRRGDRSPRDDDRYLMLETLLSAREVLYLSYLGQSQSDDSEQPPSVVVHELMSALDESFTFAQGSARAQLVRVHRLQAFSPAYFDGSRPELFSYSAANAAAAERLRQGPAGRQAAAPGPARIVARAPLPGGTTVTLNELIRFFRHPIREYLKRTAGMWNAGAEDPLSDVEPFVIGRLERHGLRRRLLQWHFDDAPARLTPEQLQAAIRAEGTLPHSHAGDVIYHGEEALVARFADCLAAASLRPNLDSAPVLEASVGSCRLSGALGGFAGGKQIIARCAPIDGRDWIEGWLRHLAWHCAEPRMDESHVTVLAGWAKDNTMEVHTLSRPEDAPTLLEALLKIRESGLAEPLPLFPKSSCAYSEAIHENSSKDPQKIKDPMEEAQTIWEGNDHQRGESEDEYYDLWLRLWRDQQPPLDSHFADLAKEVYGPIWAHELTP